MIDFIVEFLLWAVIGALPGFYVFYYKQHDTRHGIIIGAALGVVVGMIGTRTGIIASTLSGVVSVFGLLGVALMLMPANAYAKDAPADRQRRIFLAVGGVLLLLFLIYGLAQVIALPVDVAFIAAIVFVLYIIFAPKGSHQARMSNAQRISNLAYGLTLPTVIIVFGIVVFPVIWNLIFSVRDIEVADLPQVELFELNEVTLANFEAQMGLRIDPVPCETDESGACVTDENGSIVYESARRVYDDYRGYRETGEFDLFGQHYVIGARNVEFYPMIFRTFFYTLASTVAAIVVGLIAALLVRDAFPGRAIFRGFILFPYIAPVISVAFIWQVLFASNGLVNESLGTSTAFLSTPDTFMGVSVPLLMVILFQTWRYFPFAFLFLLARIQAIPDDIYEAAKVDGATPLQRLFYVTLPQLRAVFGTLFLLRFIWTFNKFDDVFLLTGAISQTKVIPVAIFEALFIDSNVGQASAIAVVMALILMVILIIYFRYFLVEEA